MCVHYIKVFTFYVPAPAAGQEKGSRPAGKGEKRAGSERIINRIILNKMSQYQNCKSINKTKVTLSMTNSPSIDTSYKSQ
jgi:hypothetical protein